MILMVFLNWYSGGWSPIGSTRHCGHQWPIVSVLGNYDGEIGGMIGRGNLSTQRKPAPSTRATAMGSQRLTTWATARPLLMVLVSLESVVNIFVKSHRKVYKLSYDYSPSPQHNIPVSHHNAISFIFLTNVLKVKYTAVKFFRTSH
jgi:hypothetical protein